MLMVRTVMSCKPGKVNALVEKFRAMNRLMEENGLAPFRLHTDLAAERFWTLVAERDYESLEEFGSFEASHMDDERYRAAMAGYHDLVVEGRREIYTVVD